MVTSLQAHDDLHILAQLPKLMQQAQITAQPIPSL